VSDNTKELRTFRDQLIALQKRSQPFLLSCASKLVMRLSRLVKKRTPVLSGFLRRSWINLPPERSGNVFYAILRDVAKYASYVELGHRKRGGKGWVEGSHMLELSEQELRPKIDGILQKELDAWLQRGMK